jgi:hypothetical protein
MNAVQAMFGLYVIKKQIQSEPKSSGGLRRVKKWLGVAEPQYYPLSEDEASEIKELQTDTKDVRDLLISVLENTTDQLYMSTALHSDFYEMDQVRREICRIADSGEVRVLLDSHVSVEEKRSEHPYLFGTDGIALKKSKKRVPHWWICDQEDLRLEKIHGENERGDQNLVILDAQPSVCEFFLEEYNTWWQLNSTGI